MTINQKIRALLKEGVYHQDELFNLLYPTYPGHYSKLRQAISQEKNR